MYREFDKNTPFDHMDIVKEGQLHTNFFKIEFSEGKIWIRVLCTFTNANADEIPYWAKMKLYPNELEKLFKVIEFAKDDAQINLRRFDGGPLGLGIIV
jgi:hypothetical protein